MIRWKVIARHKWVTGCRITESVMVGASKDTPSIRRFTATIEGWQGFRLYKGEPGEEAASIVCSRAKAIRDRILAGDESVFQG